MNINTHKRLNQRSYSLPMLLPLSPLLDSPSSNKKIPMLSRRKRNIDHKIRSIFHRRSQSSIPKAKQHYKDDERSTMSLCSITSDEYELDDTMTELYDDNDTFFISTTRERRFDPPSSSSSPPNFPLFRHHCGDDTKESKIAMITPPTPTRLTLKMRPSSSFPLLPFLENNAFYCSDTYNEVIDDRNSQDVSGVHTIEEMSLRDGDNCDDISVTSSDIDNGSTIGHIISESISYDENDENVNMFPVPTTPPPPSQSYYHSNNTTTGTTYPRFQQRQLSPPPLIRLQPKRIISLPFHSYDNYIHNDDHDSHSSATTTARLENNINMFHHQQHHLNDLHHLLLPNDF